MGSQYTDNPHVSAVAATNMTVYRGVVLSSNASGQLVATLAAAGQACDGITTDTVEAGDHVGVRLNSKPGTTLVHVTGAVARGDLLYPAANGEFSPYAAGTGGSPEWLALEDCTGAAEIQVIRAKSALVRKKITVSAGQAAAGGGNGQADIDTGLGVVPLFVMVEVRSATGTLKTTNLVTTPGGGIVRVTGAGAGNIAATDVITVLAAPQAN